MGKMKFGEKAKNPKKTFLRLMKDVFEGRYGLVLLLVLCIILSAISTTYSDGVSLTFIAGAVAFAFGMFSVSKKSLNTSGNQAFL